MASLRANAANSYRQGVRCTQGWEPYGPSTGVFGVYSGLTLPTGMPGRLPVWNELIAEGMVESHGYFVHAWASEYNVGIYTIGESIESIIAAVEESGQRIEERYGDGPSAFGEACPHHRDGFYVLGPSAGSDDSDGGDGQ